MDIKEIIRQHPKSVAVVFKKRGINAPVTTNNIMLQTILGGEAFIQDVEQQLEADFLGYESLDGDFLPTV